MLMDRYRKKGKKELDKGKRDVEKDVDRDR